MRIIRQGNSEKIQDDILMSGGWYWIKSERQGEALRIGEGSPRSQSIGFPRSSLKEGGVFARSQSTVMGWIFFARWLSIVFLARWGAKQERMWMFSMQILIDKCKD